MKVYMSYIQFTLGTKLYNRNTTLLELHTSLSVATVSECRNISFKYLYLSVLVFLQ